MDNNAIKFILNGEAITYEGNRDRMLLEVLREDFGLMGTKNGCNSGHCGTCTVIVDSKARKACITKMGRLNNSKVETIEGLAKDGNLHPLQIAFVNCGAIQCGFCTPGMIMAAKALLDSNNNPTDEQIKESLKSNICRCTGYKKIIEAVQMAAKSIRTNSPLTLDTKTDGLGKGVIRKDAIDKAKGSPIYTDDMKFKDALYGSLALSEEDHALILSIDTSAAERAPNVVSVLTAKDIPGTNLIGIISKKQPVLAGDKVRYKGDAVALILAKDKESAENAAKLVKVEYERLKPIFTMEEAKDEKGVFIHDKTNVLSELHISRGDIEKGFKEADVIVQNTITLPAIEHAYLEPDSVYAHIQDDGLLAVYTQSQSSFSFRDEIAANLDLPADKIRVVTKATGGAFGGREEPTIQVHAALGALVTKQPVRMVMSRYDVMLRTSKRHAEILKYKLGAKKNGKFTAFQADILADTGAYPSAGEAVILRSVLFSSGPYEIENADVHGLCVYTNTTPAGAMRGFGSNQPAVASEIIIDMLAEKLNIDPFEIRMINALDVGKKTIGGQYLTASIGVKESLLEVQKALAKEKLPKLENYKVGIGIASAMKNVGLGSGMIDSAGAGAVLGKENLILKVASVDSGQGSDTVVRQVAAEILKVNPYTIELIANDTLLNLDGGVTTASRQTYVTGNAVKHASILLKEKILDKAASLLKIETKELDFSDYKIKRSGSDETLLTAKELFNAFGEIETSYIYTAPNTTPVSRYTDNPTLLDEEFRLHFSYCFGTQAAIVAVNPTNGDVKVLKVIAAHDTGKVINLHGVEGQIEGGIVMGMGYALSEKYIMDATGVLTDTLRKIGVPTIDQTPEMETILIENEQPGGPFGAKGLGELSMIPTTPAIINGIYDALKIRINDLPATPDKIVEKLTSTTKK